MIEIQEKQNCCGCSACSQICPQSCITMTCDDEGFLYPLVNQNKCINCGLCERVCPEYHPYEKHGPIETYAAYNLNEGIRLESSSGGIFTLLAESVIEKGGVVFGAKFDRKWQVEITYSFTKEGVAEFRGSKYVQARVENSYLHAKRFLEEGKLVLFSGTSCQIAGLNHYLRKKYSNLLTVDVICHGVPSPKVWEAYLLEVTGGANKAIQDCKFRNKDNGWKRFNFKLEYLQDKKNYKLSSYHRDNHFMKAFLSNMILRPSCYACKAKSGKSNSDITIADFWGIENVLPAMNDDKGTGLILANTEKGVEILKQLNMSCEQVSFKEAIKYNPSWSTSVNPHPNRERFFKRLKKTKSIIKLITKELIPRKTIRQAIDAKIIDFKVFVWNVLHPKRLCGGGQNSAYSNS